MNLREASTINVLSVAFPYASVESDACGGAEQVLSVLEHGLVARGCKSTVIAREGSQVAGRLLPITGASIGSNEVGVNKVTLGVRTLIRRALREESIGLVHFHGLDYGHYLGCGEFPSVVTLHLDPSTAGIAGGQPRIVFVSNQQKQRLRPLEGAVIENGVELERYNAFSTKRQFALMLGRICPEKGFEFGMQAARLAGVPLVIAGKLYPYSAHQRYYDHVIRPALGSNVAFVGSISGSRKVEMLSAAQCLLVASTVEETSSLVAMEALASGTPVVAFRRGALADIVEHGKTGLLVESVNEMADAISMSNAIDPEDCRAVARERFSSERMCDAYVKLYRELSETR